LVLLLELPPQDPSQSVEKPKTSIRPSSLTRRIDRFPEAATTSIPRTPGNNVAKKIREP
jgi:hypothetical protein